GFLGDRPGRQRVVTRDHDGLDAHAAQLLEPLAHAVLDDVLEVDDAQDTGPSRVLDRDEQGRTTGFGDAVGDHIGVVGDGAAVLPDPGGDRTGRALADPAPVDVDA